MSKQKKYHFIYKTTCKITGKFYVGMHSTDNLADGYLGSGKILGYSRAKYGDENHQIEHIEFFSSRDELKKREKEIVNEDLLKDPLNINLKYGGDGGTHGKEFEIWNRPGYRERVSKTLRNTLQSQHAILSDRAKKLNTAKNFGSCSSTGFLGKKHSEETILKMKLSHRGLQVAEKNSQFGTCWINDGIKPIKIKKIVLDEYLSKGYSLGRKIF